MYTHKEFIVPDVHSLEKAIQVFDWILQAWRFISSHTFLVNYFKDILLFLFFLVKSKGVEYIIYY